MAKRLTPSLLRSVLTLPMADRAVLLAELKSSIAAPERNAQRLGYLADKMLEVSGIDVRTDRRNDAAPVWCRSIFAFVARREGFLQREIGEVLRRDHSTICCAEKRVAGAFEVPAAYHNEIKLYNKYIDAL